MLTNVTMFGILFIIFMLLSAIALVLSSRRKTLGYTLLSVFCFLCFLLFLGEGFQMLSFTMSSKLVGIAIANIAYSFIPFIAFCFALYFTRREKVIKSKYFLLLIIIPIIKAIGGFVNCYIPIFYTITIFPTGFIELTLTNLYNLLDVYLVSLSLIGVILVIIQFFKDKTIKSQYILFILAIIAPIMVLFLPVGREFLPICYFLALILFGWAIIGYDILDIEIIHKEFLDSANIGMYFFDSNGILMDMNYFAKKYSRLDESSFGKSVSELFDRDIDFLEFFYSDKKELIFLATENNHWFKVNKNNIYKNNNLMGYLIIFDDITAEKIKSQKLEVLNLVMEDVEYATKMAINYCDEQGKYHWSDVSYQILEREPRPEDIYKDIFFDVVIDTDIEDLQMHLDNLIKNKTVVREFKIKTETGKIKYIVGTLHKIYDNEGNFVRLNMSAQDITETTMNQLALAKSDAEKTVLLQEIHHRVKNNLQLIRSFINIEKKFHPGDFERILDITEDRITALALIHERIYNEEDMNYIDIEQFLKDFDKNLYLFSSERDIDFVYDIPNDLTLSVDIVTPLILIINELTTNSFKYAFTDSNIDKTIFKSFNLFENDKKTFCRFEFKDNGVGLPKDFDIKSSKTLGWNIIISLFGQLDAEYEIINEEGLGFIIIFPIN